MNESAVTKTCPVCGEAKSSDKFSRCQARPDGLSYRCRACMSAYKKAYYSSEPGRAARAKGEADRRKRSPSKRKAQAQVSNDILAGRIIRQPCEVCGGPHAHAHHDDYNKPLDVRWLCKAHHAEWHMYNTPIEAANIPSRRKGAPSTTGVSGVHRRKRGGFQVRVNRRSLGVYQTIDEAAVVARAATADLHN